MTPRSVRSWAVRTLMELTIATAVTVEPGDVDHRVGGRRAEVDHEVGLVEEAAADDRIDLR